MNNEIDLFRIIIDYKWISVILLIIFLTKLIKICWKNSTHEKDIIKFESLSKDEKQLYLITKFNTNINKITLKGKEKYIKRCKILILNFQIIDKFMEKMEIKYIKRIL